ncbi:calcium-binding protein [Lithospermum erythrorhizon]|uniref:Calcium-binding protein n=1 Tax=Lithospermum erythrorhizon TaxID=34254 RepID=A0AAV3RA30_LITER
MDQSHYEEEEEENVVGLPGFIFLCSGKTKPECYRYRVFGLPRGGIEAVEKIKPGSKLFLFDFELKLLYGVYEATSSGELDLEPFAFDRKFPVQVKFRIHKECLPLREKFLRQAIKDNYMGNKFKPELTEPQVRELISLFRPLEGPSSAHEPSLFFNRTPRLMPVVDPYIAGRQVVRFPPTVNALHSQDVQQRTGVEHRRQQAVHAYSGSGSHQSYIGESIVHTSFREHYPAQANAYNIPRSHQQPLFSQVFAHHVPEKQNLPPASDPYRVHYSQHTRTSNGHGQVITAPQAHSILTGGHPYTAYSHKRYITEGYPNGMTTMNNQNLQAPTTTHGLPDADQQYYPVGITNFAPEASARFLILSNPKCPKLLCD